jgi:hypothetical protein
LFISAKLSFIAITQYKRRIDIGDARRRANFSTKAARMPRRQQRADDIAPQCGLCASVEFCFTLFIVGCEAPHWSFVFCRRYAQSRRTDQPCTEWSRA